MIIYTFIAVFIFISYYGSLQQVLLFGVFFVAAYMAYINANTIKHKLSATAFYGSDKTSSIWSRYEKLISNRYISNSKCFKVYKSPTQLKYIYIHANIRKILEELDFLIRFQPEILTDLIIMLEKFLQIHYNVMVEKYDACVYIPILQDIEKDIINMFNTYVFNLPDKSTTLDIPNIDQYMRSQSKQIHAFTSKMIKIIKNKYNTRCNYQYVFDAYDNTNDEHMIL